MANYSSIHILFLVFITSGIAVSATVFTLQNSCPYTVWPGILSGNDNTLGDGGFPLTPGASVQLTAPAGWSGRFWARTGCNFDASGHGNCVTRDCGGTKYEWDASIEDLVKANFDHLAATRLKGMVSFAKSKGKQPEWILSEHWRVMLDYWMTSKAKEKSEKARSSRLFSRDGLGAHRHRVGSRSYAKVQDVLIVGMSKQGRVFGLGSLQNGVSMLLVLDGSSVSSQSQPIEEGVGTLAHRVEELENELRKSRDENLLLEKRIQTIEDIYISTSSSGVAT
ncbi:Osmotin/thaumatin-like superfamily [Arabidopsis suecica]|uniref:Osmotin/thaumatin-like superfamily n=1 Tax=Arabidopsis suecica TaxID=45249 RepID=A0A8T2BW21_ARASU|nr:Osmotin/thaumatin-like superfamily [Arabidopsis suecica]